MPSTTASNYEQISTGQPAQVRELHEAIISDAVATRTLTNQDVGALCLFDRAAGTVYTLPPITLATVGMRFDFSTSVTITSNAAKVITDSATTFLVGDIIVSGGATSTALGATANGTTIRALSSNGSTTGGVIGGRFSCIAINATQWLVSGSVSGSGAVATPFATS